MNFLRNPLSIGVIVVGLVGLAFVLVGSLIFLAAYRKRDKLAWSNGLRVAIGIGGMGFPSIVLLAPAVMSWANYMLSASHLERDLGVAAPEMKAAIVARALDGAMAVATAADAVGYLLIVPCAVMMGLALTVPFFLTKPPGGES